MRHVIGHPDDLGVPLRVQEELVETAQKFLDGRPAPSEPPEGKKVSSEDAYLGLLRETLEKGNPKPDRTGTGTFSLFSRMLRFDLGEGFPLLTTKHVHFRSVACELLWFIRGETNVETLRKQGVSIWDEWAAEDGELGPIYGEQWRRWSAPGGETIDQLAGVVEGLRSDPHSRRHLVSAWNPADVPRMALPPCHVLYQFYVAEGKLSSAVYQRSADIFLGVPFNIASYALLTEMVAQLCGYSPGELTMFLGDVHLYRNHVGQAQVQLGRPPYPPPRLRIASRSRTGIDDFVLEDFSLSSYRNWPAIAAEVAV